MGSSKAGAREESSWWPRLALWEDRPYEAFVVVVDSRPGRKVTPVAVEHATLATAQDRTQGIYPSCCCHHLTEYSHQPAPGEEEQSAPGEEEQLRWDEKQQPAPGEKEQFAPGEEEQLDWDEEQLPALSSGRGRAA
jgi:hypothetical protein